MRIVPAIPPRLLSLAAGIVLAAACAAWARDGDTRLADVSYRDAHAAHHPLDAMADADGVVPAHWLRAQDVARALSARGFTNLGIIRRRGGSYLLEATTPRRDRVRLVVDAASGEINGMQVIEYRKPR